MATATIDYDKLAQQAGGNVDYDALAAQHGATTPATNPPAKQGFFSQIQQAVDRAASPRPLESGQPAWPQRIASGMVNATLEPLVHPVRTAESIASQFPESPNFDPRALWNSNPVVAMVKEAQQIGTGPALERAAGSVGAQAGLGALGSEAVNAVRGGTPPPAQPYSPTHAAAFEGAIAPATAMGKNFIPQNVTPEALGPIRSTAARMTQGTPTEQGIVNAATSSSTPPLERIGAYQSVVQTALNDLEQQHAPALAQAANTPVDTSPIVKKLQSLISPTMDAADTSAIRNLIQRTQQAQTLGDLNGFRQELNTETAPEYKQSQIQAGRSGTSAQATSDLAGWIRNSYYDNLQQATGTDYTPLKRQEANLLTTQEALQNQQAALAKAEAIYNAPTTLREKAGNLANVIKDPKTTVTQTMLRESPATKVSTLLQKSLADLPPAPTTTGVPGPPVQGAPQGQLPAQAGGAYPMPGSAPNPATMSAGEQAAAMQQYLRMRQAQAQAPRPLGLPAESGARTVLPYDPGMSAGEKSAALLQYLRRRQQMSLPANAAPIQLPPPK